MPNSARRNFMAERQLATAVPFVTVPICLEASRAPPASSIYAAPQIIGDCPSLGVMTSFHSTACTSFRCRRGRDHSVSAWRRRGSALPVAEVAPHPWPATDYGIPSRAAPSCGSAPHVHPAPCSSHWSHSETPAHRPHCPQKRTAYGRPRCPIETTSPLGRSPTATIINVIVGLGMVA